MSLPNNRVMLTMDTSNPAHTRYVVQLDNFDPIELSADRYEIIRRLVTHRINGDIQPELVTNSITQYYLRDDTTRELVADVVGLIVIMNNLTKEK